MGMSIPRCLGHLDIRKGVVGLATGAGFVYLLYKAIRAGIKCQPPLCTASPICIARECTGPGERALPQEAPALEASSVGGPKGDSSRFLSPPSFLFTIFLKPVLEMLAQRPQVVDGTQVTPQGSPGGSPNSTFTPAARMLLLGNLALAILPKGKLGYLDAQSLL